MTVKSHPLDIYQGDDYTATINVTHNGTAVDLTGYTATAQLRKDVADNDSTIDATFTCTIDVSLITMTLAHTVTTTLAGCYGWDLQLTDPDGKLMTIARGPCHVMQEYTR